MNRVGKTARLLKNLDKKLTPSVRPLPATIDQTLPFNS